MTPRLSGVLDVFSDGDDVVVRTGLVELLRVLGGELQQLAVGGTPGDDTINLANLDGGILRRHSLPDCFGAVFGGGATHPISMSKLCSGPCIRFAQQRAKQETCR